MDEIEERHIDGVVLESTDKPRKLTKQGDSVHVTLPAKMRRLLQWTLDTKVKFDVVWDPKLGPVLLVEKEKRKEEKNDK